MHSERAAEPDDRLALTLHQQVWSSSVSFTAAKHELVAASLIFFFNSRKRNDKLTAE